MKKTHFLIIITIVLFSSCADPGGDPSFDGIKFVFGNRVKPYFDAKVFIGGMQQGVFIPTDSIVVANIDIGVDNYYFLDENRWKPNLELIRNIPSDSCYFMLQLDSQRKELIGRYNDTKLLSAVLPEKNNNFSGDDGYVIIAIWEHEITGYIASETN